MFKLVMACPSQRDRNY